MKQHNRPGFFRVYFAIATCALLLSPAHADSNLDDKTLTFQNGLDNYSGAMEIGIDQGNPGVLGNKANNLWIERHESKGEQLKAKQALVRFDNIFGSGASQIPLGAKISKATLRLNVGSKKDAITYHRIFLSRMLVPWGKDAAWKYKAWGDDGIQYDGREAVAAPDALFVPNLNNTAYEIDVTESLRAWAGGQPNNGWVLYSTRTHHVPAAFITSRVDRRELRPLLRVTYDANPSNIAPEATNLSSTHANATTATLSLRVTDSNKDALSVAFYGRKQAAAADDFQIILLPDTQYYTNERLGGKSEMFDAQTEWIARNARARNIAGVLHLGDITDHGDIHEDQWKLARRALYKLEDTKLSGLPEGVPYCLAVGNHDQRYPGSDGELKRDGPAKLFNKYFGVNHFKGKSYYGGNYGDNNNNHYTLFESGGTKIVVLSLEFGRLRNDPGILKWAGDVLTKHADRHAIVITHATLFPGIPGEFQEDGEAVYAALKSHKNLMLIVGGHTTGEGHRTDTCNGSVTHSIVQDFQFDENGGAGFLGVLTFSPRTNEIRVATYSPYTGKSRTDPAAQYTLAYDFGTKIEPFKKLATVKAESGAGAKYNWKGRAANSVYEWYAEISDAKKTTRTELQSFIHASVK
ncbi:hypothetical protein M2103_001749 [Ereboglobus sp. PH5-5]|uniref:DNRLRE domain-containing protein n=1 Tax=Ereboglobus sp. PH5-5 TaxID=2940529 RepID=UPI00240594FA|nr:DNRLRE domain-containing protein [Ereboglobus sp. PH5-5]MDF9833522.1 hypothetical protein [Ereboglobus sp. PH5-5]